MDAGRDSDQLDTEPEFSYEADESYEKEADTGSSSKARLDLYCFSCNRRESHSHVLKRKWYYPYIVGFSFGLIKFIGPFHCVCCGTRRISRLSTIHPRNIVRTAMGKQSSK